MKYGEVGKNWVWMFGFGLIFIIFGVVGLMVLFLFSIISVIFFGVFMVVGGVF